MQWCDLGFLIISIHSSTEVCLASFDVILTSRLTTRPLDNVVVELNLGEGASAIKCIAARGAGGLGRGGVGPMDMGTGGSSWAFDIKKRVSFTRSERECACRSHHSSYI